MKYCAEHKDQRKDAFLAASVTDCPYCRIAELELQITLQQPVYSRRQLLKRIAELEQQLAERDAEITRLQQQSVGWVAVFDENAALREEVERYRGVNDGYGGKVLVPK